MTKPAPPTTVFHLRMNHDLRSKIEERAAKEQRCKSDMARVLIAYALDKMPKHDIPTGSML